MPILAIEKPIFQPAMRIIVSITNSFPAIVTTSFAHNYETGDIIRLNIPRGYGMEQANQLKGKIMVTGNTTFEIEIDTTTFDPFSIPIVFPVDQQYPQCTPVGEINSKLTGATRNVLPYA